MAVRSLQVNLSRYPFFAFYISFGAPAQARVTMGLENGKSESSLKSSLFQPPSVLSEPIGPGSRQDPLPTPICDSGWSNTHVSPEPGVLRLCRHSDHPLLGVLSLEDTPGSVSY